VRAPPLKKQIEALLAHWRPILGLESWAIEVRWDEQKHTGWCIAKPKYREAMIGFNLQRIKAECRTPEQVEDLVCHELVHCVVWKASETAVSQMTQALLRAAGRKI
jgi:hypothetical protein